MANSGNSSDCKLMRYCIVESKQIKVLDNDNFIKIKLKEIINNLIRCDTITTRYYYGGNYPLHSSWNLKNNALLKMNQIRTKYWYFKSLINEQNEKKIFY